MIDRIASLATSTLANALDDAGYHDNVMPGLHSVAAGLRFAGPAVTARESCGEFGAFGSEDFKVGAIIDAAKAGDVIVIDGGGGLGSTWGGMASYAAKETLATCRGHVRQESPWSACRRGPPGHSARIAAHRHATARAERPPGDVRRSGNTPNV